MRIQLELVVELFTNLDIMEADPGHKLRLEILRSYLLGKKVYNTRTKELVGLVSEIAEYNDKYYAYIEADYDHDVNEIAILLSEEKGD